MTDELLLGQSPEVLLSDPLRAAVAVERALEEGFPPDEALRVFELFLSAEPSVSNAFFQSLMFFDRARRLYERWAGWKKHLPGQHPQWKHGLWARGRKERETKHFPETALRPPRGLSDRDEGEIRMLVGRLHNIMQDELGFSSSGWTGELEFVREGPGTPAGFYSWDGVIGLNGLKNRDIPPEGKALYEDGFYHVASHELQHSFSFDRYDIEELKTYYRVASDFEEGLVELNAFHTTNYLRRQHPESGVAVIQSTSYIDYVRATAMWMERLGIRADVWEGGEYNENVFALTQEIYRVPPLDRGMALMRLLASREDFGLHDVIVSRIFPPTRSAVTGDPMTRIEQEILHRVARTHFESFDLPHPPRPKAGESASQYTVRALYHIARGGSRDPRSDLVATILPAYLDVRREKDSWLARNLQLDRHPRGHFEKVIGARATDHLYQWNVFFLALQNAGIFKIPGMDTRLDLEIWRLAHRASQTRGALPRKEMAQALRRIRDLLAEHRDRVGPAMRVLDRAIVALEEE